MQQDEDEHAANQDTSEQRQNCGDTRHSPFWVADAAISADRVAKRVRHGHDDDAKNDLAHKRSVTLSCCLHLALLIAVSSRQTHLRKCEGSANDQYRLAPVAQLLDGLPRLAQHVAAHPQRLILVARQLCG